MKRELTLTDIAGYLPYGLNISDRKRGITTVWNWQSADCSDWNGEDKVETISGEQYSEELVLATPILRPMSDLDREITHKGETFVPIDRLRGIDGDIQFKYEKLYSVKGYCMHWITAIIDNLSEWMFDYRGLIDAGLAVSIHDLKHNPYER